MFEIGHMLGDEDGQGIGILVFASLFKDELPWLYELGLQAYKATSLGRPEHARPAVMRFARACELVSRHPMFREFFRDRDVHMIMRDMDVFLNQFVIPRPRATKIETPAPTKKKTDA